MLTFANEFCSLIQFSKTATEKATNPRLQTWTIKDRVQHWLQVYFMYNLYLIGFPQYCHYMYDKTTLMLNYINPRWTVDFDGQFLFYSLVFTVKVFFICAAFSFVMVNVCTQEAHRKKRRVKAEIGLHVKCG